MLLHLSPEAPVPPFTGGRERTRRVLAYLAAREPVWALTCASYAEAPHLAALRLGQGAQLAGLEVEPYPPRWRGYGALLPAARRLADQHTFAAVHCLGLDLWPVARALPIARRVLELHDLPARLALPPRRPADGQHGQRALLRRLGEADALVVVCEPDAAVLRQWGVRVPIEVVPNGVDLAYWTLPPSPPEAHTLLFPAAFNWPPNAEAARVLLDEVLPRLRARVPGVGLVLAGRLPPPRLRERAARDPAVALMADPPDMRPLFARAALVVVPLAAASGTRLKILQALAAGRPVVSTPAGARGLDLEPGRDLCVAELVDAFAAEVVRLLEDESARAALANAGRVAVERFAWGRVLPALEAVYPRPG